MNPNQNSKLSVNRAYNQVVGLIKNSPSLVIPFLTFAIVEALAFTIIFLAPRKPFVLTLGPIIRTFWGERFLHYPYNFLLLPKLASFSKMALSVVIASLLTGVAVAMVSAVYSHKQAKLGQCFIAALKKYVYLFIVVLVFTGLFYFISRLMNGFFIDYFAVGHRGLFFLKGTNWIGPALLCLNFLVAVLVQASFIYVIPFLLVSNEKFLTSIAKSFRLFRRHFFYTLLLVGLPMLLYVPITILNYNTIFLIKRVFPEFILIVGYLGIIISTLIIDPIITISATLTVLESEKK